MKGFPANTWFRVGRDPLRRALGHLERAVMEVVWRGGDLPVRDVQARLRRPAAYTTVMTTLDRLFKKGVVARRREGRAFVYTAAQTREQLAANVTGGVLRDLFAGDARGARPFLSNLVDAVSEEDSELLEELERLVRDKRHQLRKKRR